MNRTLKLLMWAAWIAAFTAGAVGLVQRLMYGHTLAGYGNYVTWGLWVAIYFHGVGVAGGLYLVGVVRYLFIDKEAGNLERLRSVFLLSAISLFMGLAAIALDLGRMERALNIFLSPNFRSMMTFNSWMYQAFLVILVVAFLLSYRPTSGWFKPILLVGLPLTLMFPSQSGAFFGVVDAKPFWSTALFPFLFLTSAVAAGAGLLLAADLFLTRRHEGEGYQRRIQFTWIITLATLLLYFLLQWSEISLAFWNPTGEHREAWLMVMTGPFWWVFWIVHVLLGFVTPLALLVLGRRRPLALGVAGFLMAVTFVSTRLNVLIPGQSLAHIKGLQEAFHHARLTYHYVATTHEYLVAIFLLALGTGMFYVGMRMLPGMSPAIQSIQSAVRGKAAR